MLGALTRLAPGRPPRPESVWRRTHIWVPAPREVVDPTRAGLDPARLGMPVEFDELDAPPVFICGTARSGTTWTFDLFERHPEVAAINETWLLSQTHGVTGILTQPYWDLEARRAWAERLDVPFGAVQLLSYEDMLRDLGALVASWMTRAMSPR